MIFLNICYNLWKKEIALVQLSLCSPVSFIIWNPKVRDLWRNRSNSIDTYFKMGFGRLAHKTQASESNSSWVYSGEAKKLVATHCIRLDASVVPILPWRPSELLYSCWSLFQIGRLKKLVPMLENDGHSFSQRMDVLTSKVERQKHPCISLGQTSLYQCLKVLRTFQLTPLVNPSRKFHHRLVHLEAIS